jgi:adenosylcobinamide-phosphate synthase
VARVPSLPFMNATVLATSGFLRKSSDHTADVTAAMAGALGLSIGGPRTYAGTFIQGTKLGDGLPPGGSVDIRRALSLYRRAALIFWILLAITAILSR